ncbi:MAG TPA: hypothetical protein VHM91_06370, partial [Verrucomicrobiales bacterium]|nr:hypothetical protein [Verrucomicrobiales bacterium]
VFELYEASTETETPFNILYSNTETLRPALFSAQPRPVVLRRYKDDDPLGKAASDAGRRLLEYHLDTNREGYETVTEAMSAIVLDALLPGRGLVALKYDADFVPIAEPRPPDDDDTTPVKETAEEPAEYAKNELVCPESIVWDRIYIGYAKKWNQVPWIAYEFHLTKEEVAAKIDKNIATKLTYTSSQDAEDGEKKSKKDEDSIGDRKTALIYQIWDKAGGRKIKYVSPNYTEDVLKEQDDPLQLTGFFNTPRPLMFVEKSCSLVPTAPYKMYKTQARELNRLTKRIEKITEAIKARGLYDGALGDDIKKLIQEGDNALVPAEVTSSLSAEKGFQNAIWMLPIETLIAVLTQLYQARESCKQVIYEITGISDILRGATQASETATAQQIKNQWGTLRLKRMQSEVARYIRDLLRMMIEIAGSKFSEETWAQITGLPFVLTAQRQQLEQQAQAFTQQQAMLPPERQQPLPPQLQQALAQPVWGQVLQLLKDDNLRAYRIDIETNSTVQPEAAEDQKSITDLLGVLGQYLQGVGPLVINGSMPFEAAQAMMLAIARRFAFGQEIEDSLKAMKPPQPPQQDNGAAQEAQMQQKMLTMQTQMSQKQIEFAKEKASMDLEKQKMQAEHEHAKRSMDLDMREAELNVKQHQAGLEHQVNQAMFSMKEEHANNELQTRHKQSELDRRTHALKTEKQDDGDVKAMLKEILSRLSALEGRAA